MVVSGPSITLPQMPDPASFRNWIGVFNRAAYLEALACWERIALTAIDAQQRRAPQAAVLPFPRSGYVPES